MKDILIELTEGIIFSDNTKTNFIFKRPYHGIFEIGKVDIFPDSKYNISIYNSGLIEDYTLLDKFATYLSDTYGSDENNHIFDSSIEDKSIRYCLCFDFDSLYDGQLASLYLEFWDGITTLSFLGCENIIPLNEFLA